MDDKENNQLPPIALHFARVMNDPEKERQQRRIYPDGNLCPECKEELIYSESCVRCPACFWSLCGN